MNQPQTGADAILHSLKANGIDYLFVNAGSDFAPIIESYASIDNPNSYPTPIIVPHESVAVGMAHGFYLATGRPQGVMVHVHVGLANTVMGVINAHADNVPLILMSGRTPITEHGRLGARMSAVQYGQEIFDQTAFVREITKFNYELRYAEQANTLVNRAYAIAMSEPRGPVYLSLPREPLAESFPKEARIDQLVKNPSSPAQPDLEMVEKAARLLAKAANPLMIVQRGDVEGKVGDFVSRIAAKHAIKIVEAGSVRNVVPSHHPMRIAGEVRDHLPAADVVLVVDASVPWIEKQVQPDKSAAVIHIGPDPLFQTLPMRSYQTDLSIAGNTAATLKALSKALDMIEPETGDRYQQIEVEHNRSLQIMSEKALAGGATGINSSWVAKCVSDVLLDDGLIFSERGPKATQMILGKANQMFNHTFAGGLGWGLPAAIGAQLADRDRLVVSIIGDGSYMFANPVVCHQVMETYNLPVLTVVLNNKRWNAVHYTAKALYPDGQAMKDPLVPMADLSHSPDFVQIARASRAYAERVENGADLPAALERAINVIKTEKRAALLEINSDGAMT